MAPKTSDLYIRDLKPELQKQMEDKIRKDRPELVPALDEGEDIVIGEVFTESKSYKKA